MENADIRGAKGFIVHFLADEDLTLMEQGEVMNLIRQYASNDSIVMFGHSYDSALKGVFKVTVIATGFSEEKANVFISRRPIAPERTDYDLKKNVFATFDEPKVQPESEDSMLIPAFLRRKKNTKTY